VAGIGASVGKYGGGKQCYNFAADQRVVQALINSITIAQGGAAGTLSAPIADRAVSSQLHEAILKFQKINHLSVDGHVDPNQSTIGLLNRLAAALPTAPPTGPLPAVTMSALAEKDRVTSLRWALAAVARLSEARQFLVSPPPGSLQGFPPIMPPRVGLTFDALEVHFHISTSTIPREDYIAKVKEIYMKDIHVLNTSASFFIDDTTSKPAADGVPAHVPFGSGKVNFTPSFQERDNAAGTGFGPNCRAAMVLHEPIHIVDHPDASWAKNHVQEISSSYQSQPAANQLHNAHSYAAFAQHVFFGSDTRFGAGKPEQ
jgi:hypothetical protein